nr:PLP-dependent lyase/thiolase [Clostridia bacterium]
NTKCVAASIDLTGLHMASDSAFNKKSCTTGHTGFGVPYAVDPDHSDVPRSAARPLRYMERYVTVKQGDVMYITEMLANLEGVERGPAGNTALAAAFSLAQELPEDEYIIISETEYTGAGKHIQPQLDFARQNGIEIRFGDPNTEDIPGTNIILPKDPSYIKTMEMDVVRMRKSFIKKACKKYGTFDIDEDDIAFLAVETNSTPEFVKSVLEELK